MAKALTSQRPSSASKSKYVASPIPRVNARVCNISEETGRCLMNIAGIMNVQTDRLPIDGSIRKGDSITLTEVYIQRPKLVETPQEGKDPTWPQDIRFEEYFDANGNEIVAASVDAEDVPA